MRTSAPLQRGTREAESRLVYFQFLVLPLLIEMLMYLRAAVFCSVFLFFSIAGIPQSVVCADEIVTENNVSEEGAAEIELKASFQYLTFLPKDYDQQEKWPLVLFLHGAGERGDDLEKVKVHGPPMQAAAGREFPFILVAPQCPKGYWWYPNELAGLLDQLEEKYNVDPDRIYVTGLSMGGYGTWSLASYCPERLAAVAPVCGGGVAYLTTEYQDLAVWAFHGDQDSVVSLRSSEELIERLKKRGAKEIRFTVYEGIGHNSWTKAYDTPEFYDWLLQQRRGAAPTEAK
ncbi:Phospholipase/Carboxylesterase [Polystyrenella longa]|uniref:Phospholipase/Carboxylesterase n=2 Tax=Polystyrenella longa TaxID=2528007 RepID=A0A518CQC9_9PLAN|nr:Phospholipase/Carboxylesterase [Polystyrenella longa]